MTALWKWQEIKFTPEDKKLMIAYATKKVEWMFSNGNGEMKFKDWDMSFTMNTKVYSSVDTNGKSNKISYVYAHASQCLNNVETMQKNAKKWEVYPKDGVLKEWNLTFIFGVHSGSFLDAGKKYITHIGTIEVQRTWNFNIEDYQITTICPSTSNRL